MQLTKSEHKFHMPFHISKRLNISKKKLWGIRIVGYIVAFLFAAILTTIIKPGSFVAFFENMFLGIFDPGDPDIFTGFLESSAIFLLLALALLPCFKMKYWNIGAEGCATVGCLITALITTYCPSDMPSFLVLILAVLASMVGAAIWSVIPGIFKALFNTNETLFTLMMNYVAILFTGWVVTNSKRTASGTWGMITQHQLPDVAGIKYILSIIIVILVAVLMWFYLKKTKHGYEIDVVGGSPDTAKYIGINRKKVIIRTCILSGVLCGLAGFLIVAGRKHTLTSSILGGEGFTAVLIAWLGHFEILEVVLYSCLSGFFNRGAFNAASFVGIDQNIFSGIITGLFFLVVIAIEFFTTYKIMKTPKETVKKDDTNNPPTDESKVKEEF